MSIYPKYKHLNCECGGIIGMFDGHHYICERCKKEHNITGKYDLIDTNPKTGWVFPMIYTERGYNYAIDFSR